MLILASVAVLAQVLALLKLSKKHNSVHNYTDGAGFLPASFCKGVKMTDTVLFEGERLDIVNENIRLIQKKNGLTFGTDAYLLAAFMRTAKNARVLELGGGTGIISLLCASRKKFKEIYIAEIQEDFAELCRRNASINGLDGTVKTLCSDVRDLRAESFGGELDIVFSNPPYMRADSGKRNEHDAKFIARHEVCGGIEDFCAAASRLLKFGGLFYCVYRPDRMCDLLSSMRRHNLEPKRMTFVSADEASSPSMMLVEAKKGGSTGLKMTRPLFLHLCDKDKSGHRSESEDAKKIYESCSFEAF